MSEPVKALSPLEPTKLARMMRSSQINVGANVDFCNVLERERLASRARAGHAGGHASGPPIGGPLIDACCRVGVS